MGLRTLVKANWSFGELLLVVFVLLLAVIISPSEDQDNV